MLASLLVLSFLSYMFFRLKSPGPREDREPHGYDASCAGERREETRGREEKRQRLGAGFRVLVVAPADRMKQILQAKDKKAAVRALKRPV